MARRAVGQAAPVEPRERAQRSRHVGRLERAQDIGGRVEQRNQ